MTTNGLHECLQSSYKKYHSTETALTCIHDDILRFVDEKQCVIFLLFDLSAAFDTIDHDILLSRLQKYIGLRDTALNWFPSYLSQRQHSVLINGVKSKTAPLSCGVPQGSVLGPILFTIYLLPLGDIIRKHGLQFHMYADDCHLFTSLSMSINDAVSSMQMTIDGIRAWYLANMLKLNDDKTEMLIIGSKYRNIPKLPDLNVGSTVITPGEHVRNLGIIMDTTFTMEPHINKTMQIAFLKIRQISYYRTFLTQSASKTLIHAYITSRLDYCNGLLHGIPSHLFAELQSILNTSARLVKKPRKYEHITPVMINLHWLPIQYRIQFKLLLLIYKSLHGLAPSYLTDKLSLRPNKGLRSDNQLPLNVPVSTLRLKFYGLSLSPGPHSGMHFQRTPGCVPPWQHLKPVLKISCQESLQGMTVYPIAIFYFRFVSIYIDSYLYHFIVSAVSVTSHNGMLYFNVVSQLYNSYIFYWLVCFICILCTALENIAVRGYINKKNQIKNPLLLPVYIISGQHTQSTKRNWTPEILPSVVIYISVSSPDQLHNTRARSGLILGLHPANERRH